MDVRFEIKLDETTNKNFLVFISTELTKKLKYELQETDKLNWSFKKGNNSYLDISDGYIKKELCEEEDNRYSSRNNNKIVETFIKGILVVNFKNVDSIDSVNNVFNIVNKYANLIINENDKDNEEENNELIEMIEEVALDKE